jgi:hypothetical protein
MLQETFHPIFKACFLRTKLPRQLLNRRDAGMEKHTEKKEKNVFALLCDGIN